MSHTQPQGKPAAKHSKGGVLLSVDEVSRLRIACAAATGVMAVIGPDDPLTKQYLGYARQLLPTRWDIPGWHNQRMYWHDTVAGYTTWRLPDRTAGGPPPPCSDDAPDAPVHLPKEKS